MLWRLLAILLTVLAAAPALAASERDVEAAVRAVYADNDLQASLPEGDAPLAPQQPPPPPPEPAPPPAGEGGGFIWFVLLAGVVVLLIVLAMRDPSARAAAPGTGEIDPKADAPAPPEDVDGAPEAAPTPAGAGDDFDVALARLIHDGRFAEATQALMLRAIDRLRQAGRRVAPSATSREVLRGLTDEAPLSTPLALIVALEERAVFRAEAVERADVETCIEAFGKFDAALRSAPA